MKFVSPRILGATVVIGLLAGCESVENAPMPAPAAALTKNSAPAEKAKAKEPVASVGYLTGEIPAIPGPKRVVWVGKFSSVSSFTQSFGDWDLGGGLSAMLVSALMESDRFILVERAALAAVTAEHDFGKQQGRVDGVWDEAWVSGN